VIKMDDKNLADVTILESQLNETRDGRAKLNLKIALDGLMVEGKGRDRKLIEQLASKLKKGDKVKVAVQGKWINYIQVVESETPSTS